MFPGVTLGALRFAGSGELGNNTTRIYKKEKIYNKPGLRKK